MSFTSDYLKNGISRHWFLSLKLLLILPILTSCGNSPTHLVIKELRSFKTTAEMSLFENTERISKLQNLILQNPETVERMLEEYKKSNDKSYRECIVYIGWVLTYQTEKNADLKNKVIQLFESAILDNENKIRRWAGVGLARCADESLEKVFIEMFNDPDPIMWRHAAKGLWKIGTNESQNKLIKLIEDRKGDREFIENVNKTISENPRKGTELFIDKLAMITAISSEPSLQSERED